MNDGTGDFQWLLDLMEDGRLTRLEYVAIKDLGSPLFKITYQDRQMYWHVPAVVTPHFVNSAYFLTQLPSVRAHDLDAKVTADIRQRMGQSLGDSRRIKAPIELG